jgi:7-cyano-7-deazaguanine reductase
MKLGKDSEYITSYDPKVLDFIPRKDSRNKLTHNVFNDKSIYGFDIWNAYEFSWLDSRGSPENAVLRIIVPFNSTNICESKSLKIYLGGFAFEKISSIQTLVETIQNDLSKGTNSVVEIQALKIDSQELIPVPTKGYDIDLHELKNPTFEYNNSLLKTGSEHREELLFTNSFRSLCPVTAQPDWATVSVMYKGQEILPEDLRKYLVSFRNHQGFHESCCEIIFEDILTICKPEELGVMCCFTRRGGIDISPIRSNSHTNRLKFCRTVRQ